jgi:hypothetical protein
MVNVTDLNTAASKLERRGSQAGQDFETGVQNVSDSEQQNATLESAASWETGVQEAIQEGRFETGVNNPSRSWQETTLEVGSSRFTQGVSQAGDVWQDSFQPFADTLQSLNLQPRGSRGAAANYERSRAVGEALHDARTQG